jgi:hypothetical protein
LQQEDAVEVVNSLGRQEGDVVHWVLTPYGQQPHQGPQSSELDFHLGRRAGIINYLRNSFRLDYYRKRTKKKARVELSEINMNGRAGGVAWW